MLLDSDTQDTFLPNPGEYVDVECGVCGAKMIVHRDQCGPTSSVSAMAGSKRPYDYFKCPHRTEDWHRKVVSIRQFMREVPSDVLCSLMRTEVDQILKHKWEECKGVDPHGEMWLLPYMIREAEAVLDGNTSGISTERPG